MSDVEPEDEQGTERKRWPLWKILLVAGVVCFLPCVILTGLLATLVVPQVVKNLLVADQQKAKASLLIVSAAIEQYAIQNDGRYPDRIEDLLERDEEGSTYLVLRSVPLDPWGHAYLYEPPPPGTADYRVLTYGADGKPGGEGLDQDLDNVMIQNGEF